MFNTLAFTHLEQRLESNHLHNELTALMWAGKHRLKGQSSSEHLCVLLWSSPLILLSSRSPAVSGVTESQQFGNASSCYYSITPPSSLLMVSAVSTPSAPATIFYFFN